jgi:phosphomethylpyrimidine synthase
MNALTPSPAKICRTAGADARAFPASRKAYIPGQLHADLRVPVRDIA